MSSNYSRNKYRCLLRPNHNVIVTNDNINESTPNQGPQPRIYPYGYPGIYPGYGYGYPGYGYPGYGYGYPDYGYGYSSSGVYPGTRPYPYVANEKKPRAKSSPTPNATPKNEMSQHDYYSSSSSDDECDRHPYRCNPEGYYRRYTTHDVSVSPQRVFDEQNQKPFPIPKPTPNPPIHRPPRPKPPPPPPVPAIETNHEDHEIKSKKQFAKPFAKLLTKFTTPIQNDPIISTETKENEISLGDSNLLEFKHEESVDPSMCNMNETKIYLKV
jgi:hypothetical protein